MINIQSVDGITCLEERNDGIFYSFSAHADAFGATNVMELYWRFVFQTEGKWMEIRFMDIGNRKGTDVTGCCNSSWAQGTESQKCMTVVT